MSDLTTIQPFPSEKLKRWFDCKLLHKKKPVLTGKKIWNEENGEWSYEIISVCEECDKIITPSLNDENK